MHPQSNMQYPSTSYPSNLNGMAGGKFMGHPQISAGGIYGAQASTLMPHGTNLQMSAATGHGMYSPNSMMTLDAQGMAMRSNLTNQGYNCIASQQHQQRWYPNGATGQGNYICGMGNDTGKTGVMMTSGQGGASGAQHVFVPGYLIPTAGTGAGNTPNQLLNPSGVIPVGGQGFGNQMSYMSNMMRGDATAAMNNGHGLVMPQSMQTMSQNGQMMKTSIPNVSRASAMSLGSSSLQQKSADIDTTANQKRSYTILTNDIRESLLRMVQKEKMSIKEASKLLKLNYSTAKTILHIYRKEGRIRKKRKVYPNVIYYNRNGEATKKEGGDGSDNDSTSEEKRPIEEQNQSASTHDDSNKTEQPKDMVTKQDTNESGQNDSTKETSCAQNDQKDTKKQESSGENSPQMSKLMDIINMWQGEKTASSAKCSQKDQQNCTDSK